MGGVTVGSCTTPFEHTKSSKDRLEVHILCMKRHDVNLYSILRARNTYILHSQSRLNIGCVIPKYTLSYPKNMRWVASTTTPLDEHTPWRNLAKLIYILPAVPNKFKPTGRHTSHRHGTHIHICITHNIPRKTSHKPNGQYYIKGPWNSNPLELSCFLLYPSCCVTLFLFVSKICHNITRCGMMMMVCVNRLRGFDYMLSVYGPWLWHIKGHLVECTSVRNDGVVAQLRSSIITDGTVQSDEKCV